jgi:hypothetical protein
MFTFPAAAAFAGTLSAGDAEENPARDGDFERGSFYKASPAPKSRG